MEKTGRAVQVMDECGFRAMYQEHYEAVYRYVYRRLEPSDASDVTATVFLTAWRRRTEIPRSRRLAWLYGVARRTVANDLRAHARARELTVRLAGETARDTTSDHAETVADRLAVIAAFENLSERDQEILRLVAWESLDLVDTARALGCSLPTCAVRLHRARRRLVALMTAELGPAPDADLHIQGGPEGSRR